MFGIFKRVKRLERENAELRKIIRCYEEPLSLDAGVTVSEWDDLSESEKIMRIKKLDLILTMKQTRRWDYVRNCAVLHPDASANKGAQS